MLTRVIALALVLSGGVLVQADPPDILVGQAKSLVAPGATLQKLADGMKFTEGPAWLDRDGGFLILSDQPNNALRRWDAKGGLQTFRQPSNVSNGNFALPGGAFLCCEQTIRAVTLTSAKGETSVLVDRCEGKKFHSPNDVVMKSDGTVWFTDPPYGLPKGATKEYAGQWVFCYDPSTRMCEPVAKDFDRPNGLCFSPDEKKLYIADSGKPHHVRVFDVKVRPKDRLGIPWELAGGGVFCVIDQGVPDGMRCDTQGRLWSTAGDGIQIFAPDGKELGRIKVPEPPANCCFGGPAGTTLFITARKSLYSIETLCHSGEIRPK
jgi:gluconolactonase